MQECHGIPLAELTTLRLGGPARRLIEVGDEDELIAAIAAADSADEPLLLLAGGSNLVVADQGFAGTVIRVATRGISIEDEGDAARLGVAAGEPWDGVVACSVAEELAGLECLSGIPGSSGATPIQNVGAYGTEVAETIVAVRCWDRRAESIVELTPEQCGFGYRTSALKGHDRHLVLAVTFMLERSRLSRPLRYSELARSLDVELGGRAPIAAVREAVLELRRSKGMVIDPADPDSVSAGSFFTNPILDPQGFAALERRAEVRLGDGVRPPAWRQGDGEVKTSAAWLIERAGFSRGHGEGRAGISTKHTLALVNRGDATTAELLAVARELRDGVDAAFGVTLELEPTLVGCEL